MHRVLKHVSEIMWSDDRSNCPFNGQLDESTAPLPRARLDSRRLRGTPRGPPPVSRGTTRESCANFMQLAPRSPGCLRCSVPLKLTTRFLSEQVLAPHDVQIAAGGNAWLPDSIVNATFQMRRWPHSVAAVAALSLQKAHTGVGSGQNRRIRVGEVRL